MERLGSNASSFNHADSRKSTVSPDTALPGARANFARGGLRASGATDELSDRYGRVRHQTEALITPLGPEDMVVQSMPDASPAKWHLAHTTWFFETFLLSIHSPGYRVFDPGYSYLFNSYYEALGPRQPRAQRGLLTRPSSIDVMAYRHHVDGHVRKLLQFGISAEAEALVRLGLAHEEQHQELLLMDVLHLFSQSPTKPTYDKEWPVDAVGRKGRFKGMSGGTFEVGAILQPRLRHSPRSSWDIRRLMALHLSRLACYSRDLRSFWRGRARASLWASRPTCPFANRSYRSLIRILAA